MYVPVECFVCLSVENKFFVFLCIYFLLVYAIQCVTVSKTERERVRAECDVAKQQASCLFWCHAEIQLNQAIATAQTCFFAFNSI